MFIRKYLGGGMLALAACGAAGAGPVTSSEAPPFPKAPAVLPAAGAAFTQVASEELLERSRGGADIVNNNARLSGVVSGNSAVNVSTGNNVINGGAFANAAGIPVVIQNSGANVLIQNSTIVNLQLK